MESIHCASLYHMIISPQDENFFNKGSQNPLSNASLFIDTIARRVSSAAGDLGLRYGPEVARLPRPQDDPKSFIRMEYCEDEAREVHVLDSPGSQANCTYQTSRHNRAVVKEVNCRLRRA